MWRRWVCAVIAGGLVLTACGEDPALREAQGADRRQMEAAVMGWLGAFADGDGKAACSHLTDDAGDQLKEEAGASSCEEAVELMADQLILEARQTFKNARVTRTFTRGDDGKAELDMDTTLTSRVGPQPAQLKRVEGTWKVDGFAGGAPENPVGQCITGGLQAFEQGPVDPLWKREGRADYRDYLTEVCKRAEQQRLLEDDGEVNRDAVEQIARRVIQRMVRRGQIRDAG